MVYAVFIILLASVSYRPLYLSCVSYSHALFSAQFRHFRALIKPVSLTLFSKFEVIKSLKSETFSMALLRQAKIVRRSGYFYLRLGLTPSPVTSVRCSHCHSSGALNHSLAPISYVQSFPSLNMDTTVSSCFVWKRKEKSTRIENFSMFTVHYVILACFCVTSSDRT